MRRVGYLAALGGGAGTVAAPSLRPPRRLFAHEPVLGEAPLAPVERRPVVVPVTESPAARPRSADVGAPPAVPAPEPAVEPTSVPLAPARRPPSDDGTLDVPAQAGSAPRRAVDAPSRAERPTQADAIERPHALPVELARPRDAARATARSAVHPAHTLPAGERAAASRRPAAAPPNPRREDVQNAPEPRPARAAAAEPRPAPALEPPRPRLLPEPLQGHTSMPRPAAAAAGRAPQVHIGTIEVTVVPPPPPPLPQQPKQGPVRAASAVALRSESAGRWFGLAQR